MSKLFRTEKWLTIDQLIRAWRPELARGERDPNQYEQDLKHILLQDIVNSRLDDSGPLREGRRLGLRLISPEYTGGFIEGCQLLEPIREGHSWVLHRVAVMKEAVLDFAKRRELSPPSWWAQPVSTPTEIPNDTKIIEANTGVVPSRSLGKQPRIAEYLKEHFPAGVPEPGLYPRKTLQVEILEWDPGLKPLDDATLKKAIEKYNASLIKQKT